MKKTTKWFLFGFLSNILLTSAYKLSAPFFECGPHGRFEYCIDNIPGCIIGCHCHPGYYFDTETKICEPNTQLRLTYRRQNVEEPTLTTTTAGTPTPTTTSLIDKNIDAISKDTDDLGDWLYNQFFKAIESQVINKTEEKPTRRSGLDSSNNESRSKPQEKPSNLNIQRRSSRSRHIKKQSKKKKRSKKGLRRKLLRISADDSLFDSSSDFSSESDSETDSSSWESSYESDISKEKPKRQHDHGRKILMINKKPPIPLPSFIFMPNMETPYYPPLGLPAPPPIPIPMYPMIPVPPVVPMPPGFPHPTPTTEYSQGSEGPQEPHYTTETHHTTHHNAHHTTHHPTYHPTHHPTHHTDRPASDDPGSEQEPATVKPDESAAEAATEKPEEPVKDSTRSRASRKFRKRKPNMSFKAKELAKDRFMKKLQEKMMTRYQMEDQSIPHELFESYLDNPRNNPEFEQNNMRLDYGGHGHPDDIYGQLNPHLEDAPHGHNVNFKYLSQLIHKLNNTDVQPTPDLKPMHLLQSKLHPNPPPNVRQISHQNTHPNTHPNPDPRTHFYPNPNLHLNQHPLPLPDPHLNPQPNLNSIPNTNVDQIVKSNVNPENKPGRRSGDSLVVNYTIKTDDYADLGRQIAALVRRIDSNGERQIDLNFEGERMQPNFPPQAIFNNNGFSSRSYWERFARSPFKFNFEDDNLLHIRSNEQLQLQQLSLEDQVNNVFTTPRTLDLQQIENIINFMQAIKEARERPMKMVRPNNLRIITSPEKKSDKEILRFNLKREPNEIKSVNEARTEIMMNKNASNKNTNLHPIQIQEIPIKVQETPVLRNQGDPPHVAPFHVSPPHVSPSQVSPPHVSPPQVSPPYVSPHYVSPPHVSPPHILEVHENPIQTIQDNNQKRPHEIIQVNVPDISQLKKQDKPHRNTQEKPQTHPVYISEGIAPDNSREKQQPHVMAHSTNPQVKSPNLYSPRSFIEESKAIQHKNFNMFTLPKQRFKIPLSPLLQNAVQPNKLPISNRNMQYPKTSNYQQNSNPVPVHDHNTWPENSVDIYRHYENVIKTPSFAFVNDKPSSYFHHQINHFDYFD